MDEVFRKDRRIPLCGWMLQGASNPLILYINSSWKTTYFSFLISANSSLLLQIFLIGEFVSILFKNANISVFRHYKNKCYSLGYTIFVFINFHFPPQCSPAGGHTSRIEETEKKNRFPLLRFPNLPPALRRWTQSTLFSSFLPPDESLLPLRLLTFPCLLRPHNLSVSSPRFLSPSGQSICIPMLRCL